MSIAYTWAGAIVFGLWLIMTQRRAAWAYIAGVVIFPLLAVSVAASQGILHNYLYWSYSYNLSGLMPAEPIDLTLLRKLVFSSLFVLPFTFVTLAQVRSSWRILTLGLWASAAATLIPRFGDIHAIGQLPLAAVMTGVVVAELVRPPYSRKDQWNRLRNAGASSLTFAGVLITLAVPVALIVAAPYASRPFGLPGTPANDEFIPLAERLKSLAGEDSTLYVLPLTDSTPQLYPLTDLLPPGMWVKGWSWYWDAPGVSDTLMSEWQQSPPTLVVVFPDLIASGQPGIQPFLDFVEENYSLVETVPEVPLHGDAQIWMLD